MSDSKTPIFFSRLRRHTSDVKTTSAKAINPPVRRRRKPLIGDKRLQKKLALLLPGHNEELIIASTIRSAIAAGQNKRDIYVVSDGSTDKTHQFAEELLGKGHVLSVAHCGKAGAINKALKHFDIPARYRWVHIADADSIFGANYFRIYRRKLNHKKHAVAVGFVQSLRGNWISIYRAATYTYSQHVNRRVQSKLNMISVFPGPITCFRTDILNDLDFEVNSLTEDFDITLQVHRKKLGKVLYIPSAINYTQDPQTYRDFCKQNFRWQRGFWQGVKKYRIGTKMQPIDVSLNFQMAMAALYLFQLFILMPYLIIANHNIMYLPVALTADFVLTGVITLASSVVIRRWNLFGTVPYFYFLRWTEIAIFVTAFVEVMILKRFQVVTNGWSVAGRRYKVSNEALKDVAGA